MKEDVIEQWNEQMVEKYDIESYYSDSHAVVRHIEEKRVHWILEMLSCQDHEKILEVGCGAGHVLQRVRVGKLYGIDLSPRMLSLARKRLGERAELKKCNAGNIDYPEGFFDKVICTEVLEHTVDPKVVLREIRRVAKDRGTVVLSIPNEALINRVKLWLVKTRLFKIFFKNIPEQNEWHLHSFNLAMIRLITREILEEAEVKVIPNRFLPLRYVVKYKVLK